MHWTIVVTIQMLPTPVIIAVKWIHIVYMAIIDKYSILNSDAGCDIHR
jgi:hypothetical protein